MTNIVYLIHQKVFLFCKSLLSTKAILFHPYSGLV